MSNLVTGNLFISRSRRDDDNMIPLINIVFLLLVFYMIAGEISSVMGDHVVPPFSSSNKALEGSSIVLVLDTDNVLSIHGEPVNLNQLADKLLENSGMAPSHIVLKADQQVTAASLDPVMRVLRENRVTTIALLSRPHASPG